MKPVLAPVYLSELTSAFSIQLAALQQLADDLADWLPPASITAAVPPEASAVIIADLSGEAYRMTGAFRAIDRPIVIVTSEFGTVSMWDWEIREHLRRRGVATIAPTSAQEFSDICRALGLRRQLARSAMIVYQDDLGAGMQPDIFKRFYWWEDECAADLHRVFGVEVERRSFRALAARAAAVPESRVTAVADQIADRVPIIGLATRGRTEALRLYLALGDELDEAGEVIALGINCLNESATSPTTPCLAWNLLFEERGVMWGCEADLASMITKTLVHKSLGVPVMMTNIYPFLMGQAALKHERIPSFPEVDEPENHILVAHCGYLGVVPQSFATQWTLRRRVLEIVDVNANAIDARLPDGPTAIVKIASDMQTLTITPAMLTSYVQYEGSDCRNGAVLRVADGYRFVEKTPSHHVILATGDLTRRLELMADVLGLHADII
jgi:hypothetical protein